MENDIYSLINRHKFITNQIKEMKRIEIITQKANDKLPELLKEHKHIKSMISSYYTEFDDSLKQSVITGEDILIRRALKLNELDEDGNVIEKKMIHIGLDFIHEQFNSGRLFSQSTFMSLAAAQGVGKSDYLYRMANRMLVDGHKVLLASFEFGEERLGDILAPEDDGGKDRLKDAREKELLGNLFVNYYSRDTSSLEMLIDIAHTEGIDVVLIDSFGELERGNDGEYVLQQNVSMMLNKKSNDYGMFIAIIAQVGNTQMEGEYKIKGGNDLAYKPDLSIFIKKIFEEDTSGDRIVHLIKNRDDDCNGKTIITEYDKNKREPKFKEEYDASKHSRDTGFKRSRKVENQKELDVTNAKAKGWKKTMK